MAGLRPGSESQGPVAAEGARGPGPNTPARSAANVKHEAIPIRNWTVSAVLQPKSEPVVETNRDSNPTRVYSSFPPCES
jgi:hypothetical protein